MNTVFETQLKKAKTYFIAPLIVCLVAAASYLFSDIVGYRVVALILLVTVSLIAMFSNIIPVLISAMLSALIWDYFFIPPHFTLHVTDPEDTLMLVMYFVIALVNAVLTFKIRQIEKEAREKEVKANAIKFYNALFNSLSHELKTPIAAIIGASDNLLSDTNKISEDNKHNLLSEISIASVRLNQQVENLLNMSRLESGYIQPKKDWCDVNELVYSVVNRLEEKLNQHELKIEINEKLPLFKLDFGLMEHVLLNLVNNAIIYTTAGTTITIRVDFIKIVKGHFNLSTENINPERDKEITNLVIEICDNGSGFPPDEIQKVFEKIYRLKNSKAGGTGLGLSIARGFVEAQNGTIHLSNLLSGGASFTITIPAEVSYLNKQKNE